MTNKYPIRCYICGASVPPHGAILARGPCGYEGAHFKCKVAKRAGTDARSKAIKQVNDRMKNVRNNRNSE